MTQVAVRKSIGSYASGFHHRIIVLPFAFGQQGGQLVIDDSIMNELSENYLFIEDEGMWLSCLGSCCGLIRYQCYDYPDLQCLFLEGRGYDRTVVVEYMYMA